MARPHNVTMQISGADSTEQSFLKCRICGRSFNADRIEVHQKICEKASNRQRKIYDTMKHRLKGTDLEKYARKALKLHEKTAQGKNPVAVSNPVEKKSNWRRKHEDFVQAIQAAKKVQAHLAKGGKLSDLPPPPPSENPDYIECPYCHRKFNEAAAARHIPKCAGYLHNKPKPMAATRGKR